MPEEQTPEGQAPEGQTETPPWGEDFDAEKAWKLLQNVREDNKKLKSRPVLTDAAKQRLDEYDEILAASKTDLEKANEQLSRWQSDAEKWRTAAVASRAQVLASTDFKYPDLAVGQLDLGKYLDAGGEINESAIQKDLGQLLQQYPDLARGEGSTAPRLPRPNAAQGTSESRGAPNPAQEFAAILGAQMKG